MRMLVKMGSWKPKVLRKSYSRAERLFKTISPGFRIASSSWSFRKVARFTVKKETHACLPYTIYSCFYYLFYIQLMQATRVPDCCLSRHNSEENRLFGMQEHPKPPHFQVRTPPLLWALGVSCRRMRPDICRKNAIDFSTWELACTGNPLS